MRAAWIEAERAAEVREAARGWKKAGAIDEATLAAIEAEFPVPHVELAKAWKVLIFVLVSVATLGVHVGVFGSDSRSGSYFFLAAALAGVTEVLRGSRLAGSGSDAATSFWAVAYLMIGFGMFIEAGKSPGALTATIAITGLAWAVACWRWGFSLYGAFSAMAGFLFLARFPLRRLAWVVVGAALCGICLWLTGRPLLTSPRRRAFAAVFIVSALALYAAINLYSLDRRIVEILGEAERWQSHIARSVPSDARIASAVATALVPIGFIACGIRARRRLVVDAGAILVALSVLTVEYYVRFGSVEITVFGLALIGLALWFNRRLRQAPGGEIRGFTATPLLSADSGTLSPAGALAAAAAVPVSLHPSDDADFSAGGGKYGGGGASGKF